MINTNLRQVIADYWSNFRFRQRVPLPTTPMNPQIQDHEIHIQETTNNKALVRAVQTAFRYLEPFRCSSRV